MKRTFLALALLAFFSVANAQTKVVAHRGYWETDNSAENSITSLYKAHEYGCWGSEFDVHITSDGELVVFHDDSIEGMVIKDTPYAKLRNHTLKNGEVLPTLEQYLIHAKNCKGMQLVLEIKTSKPEADHIKMYVAKILKAVKKHGLQDRTDYIAFSFDICKELRKQAPDVSISYLNGDLTPAQIKEHQFTGIDYNYKVLSKNFSWVYDSRQLGLSTNVWTVNNKEMMSLFIAMGVDYITTNFPEEAMAAVKNHQEKYTPLELPQVDLSTYKKDKNGFITLFNGSSLDGWRSYCSEEKPGKWKIDEGTLMFDAKSSGKKGDIVFAHTFKNFELELEWKISKGGNSGVFYLMQELPKLKIYTSAPEAQVLDNENHPDAKKGKNDNRKSGSLYDMIPAKPQNSKPFGEWNKLSIRVQNGLVQHFQNGKKVVEYTLWTSDWLELLQDSKFSLKKWPDAFYLLANCGGLNREGYIGLQDHGDDVWYRNIRIKVLDK